MLVKQWPMYEALNKNGLPYMREAELIHELPHSDRKAALNKMFLVIEQEIGLKYSTLKNCVSHEKLCFGLELWEHFDITRAQAKEHKKRYLLLRRCEMLPLSLIDPL